MNRDVSGVGEKYKFTHSMSYTNRSCTLNVEEGAEKRKVKS